MPLHLFLQLLLLLHLKLLLPFWLHPHRFVILSKAKDLLFLLLLSLLLPFWLHPHRLVILSKAKDLLFLLLLSLLLPFWLHPHRLVILSAAKDLLLPLPLSLPFRLSFPPGKSASDFPAMPSAQSRSPAPKARVIPAQGNRGPRRQVFVAGVDRPGLEAHDMTEG